MTKQELAKKIKEAVEYFEQDERGCYTLKLDDKLAICVGWLDGYDVTDTSVIHSKTEPTWCVNAGILK